MSALRELADRQNQHYKQLKDSLQSSGVSFRELSGSVRAENLSSQSSYMFGRLQVGLNQPPEKVFSRHKNNANCETKPSLG